MWKRLSPRATINTPCELTPGFFLRRGLRGLIIDLDNTLVPWGEDKIGCRMRDWVQEIKDAGIKVCILSNALEHRVRAVGESLGVPWVSRAVKPRKSPFRQALKILGTAPRETAVIGDQIFTDIWGGNRMGLYTIWTTPLSTKELFSTKAVRRLERLVVKKFREKGILP
ncbi:MAG: YqeG family HAD IIIA-type phosphatase [Firmicutes bacterium]|nr:YqeG family HAD IIIA-type phosphatase [Bacillota bacterium]